MTLQLWAELRRLLAFNRESKCLHLSLQFRESVSMETQPIWVHASSRIDQTRSRSRASCKIHNELEIHPEQTTDIKEREEVVSIPICAPVAISLYCFSPIYNSDRSECVSVVQTDLLPYPKRTETGKPRRPAWHYSWRLPTRGPRGRASLFLLYRLGIVCRSSWAHRVLLTCFSSQEKAQLVVFPPLGLTLWLLKRFCEILNIKQATFLLQLLIMK